LRRAFLIARPRKTTIVRSRKTGLKFEHNKAKIDFASLRPVARDEAKKLGATPGTLFAPRGKRIAKNTVFISLRQVKEHRTSEFLGQTLSLERAAKLRKQTLSNAALYQSADMRERAAKVRREKYSGWRVIAIFPKTKLEPSKQQSVGNRIIAREPSNTSRTKKRKHICNVRPWRSTPKARQTRRRSPRFKFSTGF
jgi:hypothetical protein